MTRKKPRRGELFEVDLGDGRYTAAIVLKHPLVAFFEFVSTSELDLQSVTDLPVAFRCWIMDSAFRSGNWRSLGIVDFDPAWEEIAFAKKDVLSGKITAYRDDAEMPTTLSEALLMEPAAVWGGTHIIERLRDHFDGKTNVWLESLRSGIRGERNKLPSS